MRATIHDVAKLAGVSPTTVSLVLNGKAGHISQRARESVIEAARALDYHPNRTAVNLATRKTKMLGFVISNLENLFMIEMLKGFLAEAKEHDYMVLTIYPGDKREGGASYEKLFRHRIVDGVVMPRSAFSDEIEIINMYDVVTTSGIPVIALDIGLEGIHSKVVTVDNRLGGYLATKHLIDYGHKRIGVIAGKHDYVSAQNRLLGYRDALEESGIDYDESLVYTSDYTTDGGAETLPYLLGKNVTAVFAHNDMMAFGVYRAAKEFGLTIPKDLSVVGFDDVFLSQMTDVPLTTVAQPIVEIGQRTVKEIVGLINTGAMGDRMEKRKQAELSAKAEAGALDGQGKQVEKREDQGTDANQIWYQPVLKVRGSTARI